MEIALWMMALAVVGLLITVGGKVWALATRISTVEAKADTAATRADVAGINVAANTLKVDKVAADLATHREDVAGKYVSYANMVALENRLVDAITGLGNRIDGLFSRVAHS